MTVDEEGFQYPAIDEKKCISCHKCEKVCAFVKEFNISDNNDVPDVYAANGGGVDVSPSSSSAGVGNALAKAFIHSGGIVYGVGFDDDFVVKHIRLDAVEDVFRIDGSKYVQSNLDGVFESIEVDLNNERKVLFFGTACQTAGLYSFISNKKHIDNLYLVDVLCHGVPSPGVFKDYLQFASQNKKSGIKSVVFRSKVNGWISAVSGQKIVFENGKEMRMSLFSKLFFGHYILRPSCNQCVYTRLNKPSDMTLADFWRIREYDPSMYTSDGVSMVLVNSSKGKYLFDLVNNVFSIKKMEVSCCDAAQFKKPASFNPDRDKFFLDYKTLGSSKTLKKYQHIFFVKSIEKKIVNVIKKG